MLLFLIYIEVNPLCIHIYDGDGANFHMLTQTVKIDTQ